MSSVSLCARVGVLALIFVGILASPVAGVESPDLRAGVSRIDLTPPLEMKAALGGYGARLSKPAVGIHDRIWAKAMVLNQGERRFAIVTADVLAFPPGFKPAVLERLSTNDWKAEQIMLLASHSHTSLDMMALHPGNVFGIPQAGIFHRALFERTADQLAELVRQASKNLLSVSTGSKTITVPDRNRNRRHGGGTHDPDLTITRIDAGPDRPLAILVNWTAHPTFMDAEDMLFSGDWPGHLQRTVEALIGHGVTVMYYNGGEGDQSPVPPADCGSGWERAEHYGREMGIIAWHAWQETKPRPTSAFEFHTEMIALPKRQAHPDFMKTGGREYGLNPANMDEFLNRLVPAETHSTSLRLGDLLLLGVPGEMAADLAIQAKSEVRRVTGATCVTIGGLADEWISYILPEEEYRRGGYEGSMSFYGETLGRILVEGIIRGASKLK